MTMTPQLPDQRIVVIGGTKGVGLGIPRLARHEDAHAFITPRDPDRLHRAGLEEMRPG
jgi:hypothetical protein